MRILIVNKYFFPLGGPEQYMFRIIRHLERRGHTVIPLALRLKHNHPSPYENEFLDPPAQEDASHFEQFSLGLLGKLGLLAHSIYSGAARRQTERLIRAHSIDVVYLLNICNYISPSVLYACQSTGARAVMRLSDYHFICASYHFERNGSVCRLCERSLLHALRYRCLFNSLSCTLARILAIGIHRALRIYHRADAVIAPSQHMREALERFGLSSKKVHVVPGFADVSVFTPSDEEGDYVLYLGRLAAEKGIDILLKAWHLLAESSVRLHIAGGGPEEEDMKQLAEQLCLSNVIFRGHLSDQQCIDEMRGSKLLVCPSVCHDNAPAVIYEAMACAKPVVASRVGGIRDQVEDGRTGLLVAPGDARALADALKRLLVSPSLRAELGRNGRERMMSRFHPDVHLERLEEILAGMTVGDKA